jgi:hypothetical protein
MGTMSVGFTLKAHSLEPFAHSSLASYTGITMSGLKSLARIQSDIMVLNILYTPPFALHWCTYLDDIRLLIPVVLQTKLGRVAEDSDTSLCQHGHDSDQDNLALDCFMRTPSVSSIKPSSSMLLHSKHINWESMWKHLNRNYQYFWTCNACSQTTKTTMEWSSKRAMDWRVQKFNTAWPKLMLIDSKHIEWEHIYGNT